MEDGLGAGNLKIFTISLVDTFLSPEMSSIDDQYIFKIVPQSSFEMYGIMYFKKVNR